MAKMNLTIEQFRFYGIGDERNNPKGDESIWFYGTRPNDEPRKQLLSDYGPALKIGIQGLPGTIFHLSEDLNTKIMLDHTGVYELDLTNTNVSISTLYFDHDSLITINRVNNTPLIVDILCYEKDSE